MNLKLVEKAISEMKKGRPIIVIDDESRENEGDLIIAAEKANDENIAFMIRYTSGILCVPMKKEDLDRLEIPMMVDKNTEKHQTAFTVSVDSKFHTTTGISSKDRLQTIKTLISPATEPKDLLRPGHVFPLKYKEGGVLKRAGHTEAGVDLAILSGCFPAAVLAEIVNENGSVSKFEEIKAFGDEHHLVTISIADLVRYRRRFEKMVHCDSKAKYLQNMEGF